jgi:hypothetical protein
LQKLNTSAISKKIQPIMRIILLALYKKTPINRSPKVNLFHQQAGKMYLLLKFSRQAKCIELLRSLMNKL